MLHPGPYCMSLTHVSHTNSRTPSHYQLKCKHRPAGLVDFSCVFHSWAQIHQHHHHHHVSAQWNTTNNLSSASACCLFFRESVYVCAVWSGWKRGRGGVLLCTLMGCGETCPSAWSWNRRSLWGVELQTKETYAHTNTGSLERYERQTAGGNPQLLDYFLCLLKTCQKKTCVCLSAAWIHMWAGRCFRWSALLCRLPEVCVRLC